MLNIKNIKSLYAKYSVQASKRFGQNFLIDPIIVSKIIQATNIENQELVEIGPGLGSLTHELLKKAKIVQAYEVDQDMIKVLSNEIDDKKFILLHEDFIKANLDWSNKKILIANIPYNITTQIIFKILENKEKFSTAILMVQKEYGERLLAKPTSKNYGKLSVSINSYSNVEKVTEVSRSSFIPSPKVDSVVIQINFLNNNYDKKYLEFIKKSFSFQRKTLVNNLTSIIDKKEVLNILDKLSLKQNIRPQELSIDDFKNLYALYLTLKKA